MMMPYIFWFVLFFSLHARAARLLGCKVSELNPVPISRKEIRLSELDIQSTTHHHVIFWGKMVKPNSHDETGVLKLEDGDGSNVVEASYSAKQDTHEEIREVEGRSTLQSSTSHEDDVEEKVDSKEHEFPEDVVAMDYAQPQRKPPIHNTKKP